MTGRSNAFVAYFMGGLSLLPGDAMRGWFTIADQPPLRLAESALCGPAALVVPPGDARAAPSSGPNYQCAGPRDSLYWGCRRLLVTVAGTAIKLRRPLVGGVLEFSLPPELQVVPAADEPAQTSMRKASDD